MGAGTFTSEEGRVFRTQGEIGRGVLTFVLDGVDGGGHDEARERAAGGRYAIKTVLPLWTGHPLAEARIARERELSIALHDPSPHPSCQEIVCGGRQKLEDGRSRPFHVSPLYDGETLADRLRNCSRDGKRVPVELALRWADDVLAALGRLHAIGWVHRDVKPQNVFIVSSGADGARERALLMDYGLAMRAGAPRIEVDEPFGTPAYVSPEVVAGATLDGRADLYSLALILFELFCGQRPFTGLDPIGLVEAHLGAAPPSPRALCPHLSPEMDRVISRALAKAPGERPANAAELAGLLRTTPEARALAH